MAKRGRSRNCDAPFWRSSIRRRTHYWYHDILLILLLRLGSYSPGGAAATVSSLNVTELDCRMRRVALNYALYLQPWRRLLSPLEEDRTFQHVRDALRLKELCLDEDDGEENEDEEQVLAKRRRRRTTVSESDLDDLCSAAATTCIYVDPRRQQQHNNHAYSTTTATGNAAADGSLDRPVATAAAALELSRKHSLDDSSSSPYNTTIVFRAGIHFLSATLELDARDSGLTFISFPGEQAWLSGAIEIPANTHWGWDCASHNLHVRVANLTDLLRGLSVPKVIQSVFSTNHRLVRARFPNGNPETDQWGYNSPDRLRYSIAADQVLEWHKPAPGGVVPTFEYVDLRRLHPHIRKNDSTMELYNVYASGSGGVCADLWGPHADSYWCSNASDGGWAEVDRQAAVSGRLQIPVGMTYNRSNAIGRRLGGWKDAAVGAIVHAWHSQSWAMHMFEIIGDSVDDEDEKEDKGTFHFAPGGGKQGARNWCRCDQCTYAGPWCGQHQDPPWPDDRLISGTWMVENVRAELDAPGEFYFDFDSQQLYVYPNITNDDDDAAEEEDGMAGLRNLRFALLETLVRIQGGAKDITFTGLGFRDSAATYMSDWSAPSGGDWSLHRGGALFVQDVENVIIQNCVFRRLDGNAVFLSRRTRNVIVRRNSFEWLGESAVATWGETNGFNGTARNFPLGTLIEGNVMRELGIYEKQSSGVGHNKAAETIIRNNIIFNVPRAAINFNDMLGGGDIVRNLIFNSCRESGDHGPINSWDRQPYLTNLRDGSPSFVPTRRSIASNLIFANYGASQSVDNDDGSSWYHVQKNVFYSSDGVKMDYGGHDSIFEDNLVIRYPWKRTQGRPCVDLGGTFFPGHGHVVRRNTCLVPTDEVPIVRLAVCNGTNAILHDNIYMVPNRNATVECGYQASPFPFEKLQASYPIEQGSVVQRTPDAVTDVIKMVSAVLYPVQTELSSDCQSPISANLREPRGRTT